MIPTIGVIVAIYGIARLMQVPLEYGDGKNRGALMWISIGGILGIAFFTLALLGIGGSSPQ